MSKVFNPTEPYESKQNEQPWGTIEWMVHDSLTPGVNMSVAVMNLLADNTSPLHRHPNSNEFCYLLEGQVEITVDDKKQVLNAGDSVLIPIGTAHGFKNTGTQTGKMFLSYSEGRRIFQEL